MKVKAIGNPGTKAGVYKAKIEDIRYHKDEDGNLIENSEGENGLEFDFKCDKGILVKEIFWWGASSMFKLRKLLRSVGVNTSEGAVPATEAIGEELWLCVKEIITYEDNKVSETKSVLFDFVNINEPKPSFSKEELTISINEESIEEPEQEVEEEEGF